MWLMPRSYFLLAPLFIVTTVQAAPFDPPAHGEGSSVWTLAAGPHASNEDARSDKSTSGKGQRRSGSRYGIGYEARHGVDAGTRSDRVERMERPERPERIERPERMERDGRGR
jgi:hypothetical protein